MDSGWTAKSGTFSHQNAMKEFGLTEEEIYHNINNGRFDYRQNWAHGNPYFRLLRSQVEAYVIEKYGEDRLVMKKNEKELKTINSELRKLKKREKELTARKEELTAMLKKCGK